MILVSKKIVNSWWHYCIYVWFPEVIL